MVRGSGLCSMGRAKVRARLLWSSSVEHERVERCVVWLPVPAVAGVSAEADIHVAYKCSRALLWDGEPRAESARRLRAWHCARARRVRRCAGEAPRSGERGAGVPRLKAAICGWSAIPTTAVWPDSNREPAHEKLAIRPDSCPSGWRSSTARRPGTPPRAFLRPLPVLCTGVACAPHVCARSDGLGVVVARFGARESLWGAWAGLARGVG